MKRPPLKNRLPRSFYARPTERVARELLGKALLRRIHGDWVGGMIVETEAYLPTNDLACHAARGKTPSNANMFARPGTLYVYPIHANYCMNAVTEREGVGCAALVRAIEPLWGIESMRHSRGLDDIRRLTRGPGMLCQAMQVDRAVDGTDLVRDGVAIVDLEQNADELEIVETPRIGISKAVDLRLRFLIRGNRFVSKHSGQKLPT